VKNLGDRAVSYLNVDLAFEGNVALRARALPIMRDFIYDVAQRVLLPSLCLYIQGVAVTRLARRVLPPGELRCICASLQTTNDDRRRRQTTTDTNDRYYTPPTLCVGGPVLNYTVLHASDYLLQSVF